MVVGLDGRVSSSSSSSSSSSISSSSSYGGIGERDSQLPRFLSIQNTKKTGAHIACGGWMGGWVDGRRRKVGGWVGGWMRGGGGGRGMGGWVGGWDVPRSDTTRPCKLPTRLLVFPPASRERLRVCLVLVGGWVGRGRRRREVWWVGGSVGRGRLTTPGRAGDGVLLLC